MFYVEKLITMTRVNILNTVRSKLGAEEKLEVQSMSEEYVSNNLTFIITFYYQTQRKV